jgi:hypothetical protein
MKARRELDSKTRIRERRCSIRLCRVTDGYIVPERVDINQVELTFTIGGSAA